MTDETDVIAATVARERELLEKLAAAPIADVVGIIDASGAGGARSPKDSDWTLRFWFAGWRIAGSAPRTSRLTVRQKVTDAQLRALMQSLTPYSVVRIRAHVLIDSLSGAPEALSVQILGPDTSDAELQARAAELQKPVVREDRVFGILTLDRRFDWYIADTTWNGQPVKLHVSTDDHGDVAPALRAAHALWEDQAAWNAHIPGLRRVSAPALEKHPLA